MTVYVSPGLGNINCDECGAEFEVIPTNDSYNEVSFCPFCGSEVVVNEEELFDEDEDDEQ